MNLAQTPVGICADSETPLGVAMSIEPRHRDITAAQFPANPDESGLAGNWGTTLWASWKIIGPIYDWNAALFSLSPQRGEGRGEG